MEEANIDRRRFPRLKAPILYNDGRWFARSKAVLDASVGGVRIHSDEPLQVGRRLDVELLLATPNRPAVVVRADAEVAWLQELDSQSPARFEVGLAFINFPMEHFDTLKRCLEQEEGADDTDAPSQLHR